MQRLEGPGYQQQPGEDEVFQRLGFVEEDPLGALPSRVEYSAAS